MISVDDWAPLESISSANPGVAIRRIAPASGHDIFLGVRFPGRRRQLVIEVPEADWPADTGLPEFKSLGSSIVDAAGHIKATIELEDPALNDVFTALVNDVAQHVASARDRPSGVSALEERLLRWRRLMEPDSSGGMTRDERRGLFGELRVIEIAIDRGLTPASVLDVWTGPLGAHQDFQHPRVAIEVKTTSAKQPQALAISSERQLDLTGIAGLAVIHLSLDERSQGVGRSLPRLIEDVRKALGQVLEARFSELLTAYGWIPGNEHRYDTPLYTERSITAYEVVDEFPRLTEADCPIGVGDVRYLIQLGALTPFVVEVQDVLDLLGTSG